MTRRVVVTGGGTGIGRAIAAAFVADGDRVTIVGRRSEVLAEAAADLNAGAGASLVEVAIADLTEPDQVERLGARLRAGPPIDVLVNNAGGSIRPAADDDLAATAAVYEQNFRLNVLPAVLLATELLPHITQPGGRIVSIGSIAALTGRGPYGPAKAALHSWALGLAKSVAAQGITVNIVAPGFIPDTEFWSGRLDDHVAAGLLSQIPAGRAGTPADIAAAVHHLAAEESGWTTGQIIQVNGGQLLGRG